MTENTAVSIYHVLLIGIDRYPPDYRSLAGCVNDIDAIEDLLLSPPGVGIPAEQIRITRLAAPRPEHASTSRFVGRTLAPTKANVVQALRALAGSMVEPSHRVLILYSGHGDERLWTGSPVWHEALVPRDDRDIDYLFDVEVNVLIGAIAQRTTDLTVVIDACHSGGSTRGDPRPQGGVRAVNGGDAAVEPPDLAALGLGAQAGQHLGAGLLRSLDPDYVVIAACQSDESAREGAYLPDEPAHGVLTYSLLRVLRDKDGGQRARLRWADIWPELLVRMVERNTQLGQRVQHPWIIGRPERRLFGGAWEKMDAGYRVTRQASGEFEIAAGELMGVTAGAQIAVYGPETRLFEPLGSDNDHPAGRLTVRQAGLSSAVAVAPGAAWELPDGARGRLVKPGHSCGLRVRLRHDDASLQGQLERSPLLAIVSANAEVEVIAQPDGGWFLGNDIEPVLAIVPPGECNALRAGLESYYRYNTVLRMAHRCDELKMSKCLDVRLLDCSAQAALSVMSAAIADPDLPELPRDAERIYTVNARARFCVKVTNSSPDHLNITLLDCSAGGLVEYLSDATLRGGAAHVMWLDGRLGEPFEAGSNELPDDHGIRVPDYVTDRLLVIGTTRREDLHYLAIDKRVQQVVDENRVRRGDEKSSRPQQTAAAPAELWTATLTHLRIMRH